MEIAFQKLYVRGAQHIRIYSNDLIISQTVSDAKHQCLPSEMMRFIGSAGNRSQSVAKQRRSQENGEERER